jgi:flagellar hook-associated protein 3 FlgL
MITSLDSGYQRFLSGLTLIQRRADKAQIELTSGFRINTVSDDPDHIATLLQTRSDLGRIQQIHSNLNRVKTEADAAEGVLSSAVTSLDRVQTLGSQGQSGFETPENRAVIAGEIGSVLQQLVSASNTSVEGRFIFAGDSDQQQPYSIDLTQANAVSGYGGSAGTRQIDGPDGSVFSIAKTAQQIFDNPNTQQNVFVSVNNLRVALQNNDQAGIDNALIDVQSASKYLNSQLAFYGTVQNRVNGGIDFASTFETQLRTNISGLQDADLTQSILELTQAKTQQDAALSAQARLPRTSLFDFLG